MPSRVSDRDRRPTVPVGCGTVTPAHGARQWAGGTATAASGSLRRHGDPESPAVTRHVMLPLWLSHGHGDRIGLRVGRGYDSMTHWQLSLPWSQVTVPGPTLTAGAVTVPVTVTASDSEVPVCRGQPQAESSSHGGPGPPESKSPGRRNRRPTSLGNDGVKFRTGSVISSTGGLRVGFCGCRVTAPPGPGGLRRGGGCPARAATHFVTIQIMIMIPINSIRVIESPSHWHHERWHGWELLP
jgi:hypothetical protein